MESLIAKALEDYVREHTSPEPELLVELRRETRETLADPQMQVGRVEGALLKLLVQVAGARDVLEVGTFSGYSALCMASGLPEEGRLITCDVDPVATAVARRFFERSAHGSKIELRMGPAAETLGRLADAGEAFDLVFLDADKEGYVAYYEAALPMLRPGGLLVADNALWSGKVLAPRESSDHGIARFNDHVREDRRVEQVLLSVRDGILLCRKRC